MTSQLTPERTDTDVLPKDFDAATGPIWLQPWFWLAIIGVIGMVALTAPSRPHTTRQPRRARKRISHR